MRDYLKPKMAKPVAKAASPFFVTVVGLILMNVGVILYHGDPSTKLRILTSNTKSKLLGVDVMTQTSMTVNSESNNDILPSRIMMQKTREQEGVGLGREVGSWQKVVGLRGETEHQQEQVVALSLGEDPPSVRGEGTAFRALSRLKERLVKEIPTPQRDQPDFTLHQQEGQSSTQILVKAGISESLTHFLLQKFANHINFQRLMPGTAYNFWFDGSERLQCIEIWPVAKRGVRAQLWGENWKLGVIGGQYAFQDSKDRGRHVEVGSANDLANWSVALSSR